MTLNQFPFLRMPVPLQFTDQGHRTALSSSRLKKAIRVQKLITPRALVRRIRALARKAWLIRSNMQISSGLYTKMMQHRFLQHLALRLLIRTMDGLGMRHPHYPAGLQIPIGGKPLPDMPRL